MPIDVVCPNGHQLKVKDKYAGKSGLCPQCRASIAVPAHPGDEEELIELVPRKNMEEELSKPLPPATGAGHIDDDDDVATDASSAAASAARSAGESLLSSAVIKHQKMCPKCHQLAPIWYARCLNCDAFFRG